MGKSHMPTLFPSADVSDIVQSIRDEAAFVGLNLPAHIIDEIKAFALTEPLQAIYDPKGATFYYSDVQIGIAADGRPMPIGGVSDPARCPAKIINDPVVRSCASISVTGHERSPLFST